MLIFITESSIITLFFIIFCNTFYFVDGFKPSNVPRSGDSVIGTDDYDPSKMQFMLNKGGIGSEEPKFNMNYGLWLTSNGHIEGGFETANGENYFLRSVSTYNDGKWHNAIITFDSDNEILILYIDGAEIDDLITNTAKPDNTGNQPVRLGTNSFEIEGKVTGNYTGELDDIQVWDIALTKDQALHLYKKGLDLDRYGDVPVADHEIPEVVKNSDVFEFSGMNYADVVNSRDINLNSFTVSVWFNAIITPSDTEEEINLYNKTNDLYYQGKYEEVIKYYDKVLEIDPNDTDALNSKGIALDDLDKYKEAITDTLNNKAFALANLHKNADALPVLLS